MIGGANIKTGSKADFFCDYESDISDLSAFGKEYDLKMGSTCFCIETSKAYMMQSDYHFVEMQ